MNQWKNCQQKFNTSLLIDSITWWSSHASEKLRTFSIRVIYKNNWLFTTYHSSQVLQILHLHFHPFHFFIISSSLCFNFFNGNDRCAPILLPCSPWQTHGTGFPGRTRACPCLSRGMFEKLTKMTWRLVCLPSGSPISLNLSRGSSAPAPVNLNKTPNILTYLPSQLMDNIYLASWCVLLPYP